VNRDEVKALLPVMQAFAEGKAIEYKNEAAEWVPISNPNFLSDQDRYRVKPESKTVLWTRADVPPVCWLRHIAGGSLFAATAIWNDGVAHRYGDTTITWTLLSREYQYSTDLKTWHPCTKVVTE